LDLPQSSASLGSSKGRFEYPKRQDRAALMKTCQKNQSQLATLAGLITPQTKNDALKHHSLERFNYQISRAV
jgi:hypothetical protein